MASSKSQLDTSIQSLRSIAAHSPILRQQSSIRVQINTQQSVSSPRQGKFTFSPRRTVLRTSPQKIHNQTVLPVIHDANSAHEGATNPFLQKKLPEDIISPFPLQQFSLERQTSNFMVMLLNKGKNSTLHRNSSWRSITPSLGLHTEPSKGNKIKVDIETIFANMKEISTIAPTHERTSPQKCCSLEVQRNTLEDELQTPFEHLSLKSQAKHQKRRNNHSIFSFLDKKLPPRLAYRRKSCCCDWCGGINSLQRDVENNPWVSLLTGWEAHAATQADTEDIQKKNKEEPIMRKKRSKDTLFASTTRKILYAKKHPADLNSNQMARAISFRDIDERGIAEAREIEENTPSRSSVRSSTKKLKAFLGTSPKTTTAAISSFGKMKINLTNLTAANNNQNISGSSSLVFDRNETDLRGLNRTKEDVTAEKNARAWNIAVNKDPSESDAKSVSHMELSSVCFNPEKSVKGETVSNENRFLGGFVTTRSKDSRFSIMSTQAKRESIFGYGDKGPNFTEAVKKNQKLSKVISPPKKEEKDLKSVSKISPTSFARKVIRFNANKDAKTEREQKMKQEVQEKQETQETEKEVKKDAEEKAAKRYKMKSIKRRNKDIMHVYMSTSLRSPSNLGVSPRGSAITQIIEKEDLSFIKDDLKEKKKQRGNVKLKIRRMDDSFKNVYAESATHRKNPKERAVL